jgi:hypothetical protein
MRGAVWGAFDGDSEAVSETSPGRAAIADIWEFVVEYQNTTG